MLNETVRLSIGGQVHETWDGWSIQSDLLTAADTFELELYVRDTIRLPEMLAEGAPCTLTLGSDLVLTGQVDEFEHDISRQGVAIRIVGRDKAAVLVDCSTPEVSLQEVSLQETIEKIVKPLGISKIEIQAQQAPELSRRVQIEPGQTAWEVLLLAAEANGLWPWMTPDGRLIIGGPDYNAPPVHTLILRQSNPQENNVERLSVRRSIARRYSQVTVLGQHGQYDDDGWDTTRSHISATIEDTALARRGIFRPKVVVDAVSETRDLATSRARKLLADSKLDALQIRAVVPGYRTSAGQVFEPGQRLRVISEPHGLDAIFFLMARTMRLTRSQGAITELVLHEDNTWILDANPGKRRGDQNADLALIEKIKSL